MKKNISLLSAACAVCMAAAFVSCSSNAKFIGSWTAVTPTDITSQFPGASSATSLVTISLSDNLEKTGGNVTLSTDINVAQTFDGDSLSAGKPYEVKFAATASVPGTWTYDVDDDDDILLALDLQKLDIKVDPSDVTVSAAGVEQTRLDSLAGVFADNCRRGLPSVLTAALSRYTVIEDMEVARDGRMMSFEIQSPETKLRFRKNAD